MRSITAALEGQAELPVALPMPVPRRARRRTPVSRGARLVHRLGSDALASRGLPAGTEVLVDPDLLPRRGHLLFVRVDGRLRVGFFEVELGRAVLRSDHGSIWLDRGVEVVGVAVEVSPPLL